MKGAIYFSGKYGSTAQYALWISEATGLPMHDINKPHPNPEDFDFLVLGSSVIIGKLTIRHWVKQHLTILTYKPIVLFTVSGAGAGPEVDAWVAKSLPEAMLTKIQPVALRGKLDIDKVGWWTRLVLRMGAWATKDPQAKKEMLHGFDFMDKSSIDPILRLIESQNPNQKAKVKDTVTI